MKLKAIIFSASLLTATFGVAACEGDTPSLPQPGDIGQIDPPEDPTDDTPDNPIDDQENGPVNGGGDDPSNDPQHNDSIDNQNHKDPMQVLQDRQEEGPAEIRTRLHSCGKIQIRALRRTLSRFGVDLAAGGENDAGRLVSEGVDALGGSNYGARAAEAKAWTNSGATKFQDIFVRAASEIITNLPNQEHCQVGGVGPEVFLADGTCNPDALTCLAGRPASEQAVAICNQAVSTAPDENIAQELAIGAFLAAEYSCN